MPTSSISNYISVPYLMKDVTNRAILLSKKEPTPFGAGSYYGCLYYR